MERRKRICFFFCPWKRIIYCFIPFSPPFSCSLAEQRIYSIGKTILCFIIFLICIQPLLLCYLREYNYRIFVHFSYTVYMLVWSHGISLAVVSVTRMVWRNILIVKNPQLNFVKKGQFTIIQLHEPQSRHRQHLHSSARRTECRDHTKCRPTNDATEPAKVR